LTDHSVPVISLRTSDGRRDLGTDAFPLAIGGPESGIELASSISAPAAVLGVSGGDLFLQPGEGVVAVFCNGSRLAASRWLRHSDVIRIGDTQIVVGVTPGHVELVVTRQQEDDGTDPPVIVAAGRGGRDAPVARIQPVAFSPLGQVGRSKGYSAGATAPRPIRVGFAAVALGVAFVMLASAAWFVFTAESVAVQIEPVPDRVAFEGGWPGIPLGGRHLLRAGQYTLVAEKEGYRTLEVPVRVDGSLEPLKFELAKLPGRLTVDAGAAVGARVFASGAPIGATPLEAAELAVGSHEIRVEHERYLPFVGSVTIEGGGVLQTLEVDLTPNWAQVAITSEPSGAAVSVDGKRVGTTPLSVDIPAGNHVVGYALGGFKPVSSRIGVTANEARSLPVAKLQPSDGNLALTSDPGSASVSVDGKYLGDSPLDLYLSPGRAHSVRVSKRGHATRTIEVSVASGESRTIDVTLEPHYGELAVVAAPPDAEVLVDGSSRGAASQVLRLLATPHEIVVRKRGFETFRTEVTIRPDFPQTIQVELVSLDRVVEVPSVIQSGEGLELRLIDAGTFRLGASRREPGRRSNETLRDVELKRRFYLSTMTVTNRQFRRFRGTHLSGSVAGYSLEVDSHPVVHVSWQDAAAYCNWLSAQESLPAAYVEQSGSLVGVSPMTTGYRLPTEAEWARAARYAAGPSPLKYPWGEALPIAAGAGNFADQSALGAIPGALDDYDDHYPATSPVDVFPANALGLFGMGGNVAEWVHDFYTTPASSGEVDPLGPARGDAYVIRGSSFMHATITELRLAYRDYGVDPRPDVGFRIARYAE
jgi:formylglycine-generating enzyme required for sulfatase activity